MRPTVSGCGGGTGSSAMRTSQCRTGRPTQTSSTAASAPEAAGRTVSPGPSESRASEIVVSGTPTSRKRDRQARFGQAVDRKHDVVREPRGRERRRELAAQVRRDRLGAVEDDANGGADRARPPWPRRGDLQVMHVAEVRRAGDRRRDARWPWPSTARAAARTAPSASASARRRPPAAPGGSRSAPCRASGHPRQAGIAFGGADPGRDGVDVGHQVAMREHDALGLAGRPRRILDERDVVRRGRMKDAGMRECR